MRSEEEASRAIDLYGDTVKRICMIHLKNYSDTEDIFQTVFLKYVLHAPDFDSSEHEKAWIIRVTINACKDLLKSFFKSRTLPLDSVTEKAEASAFISGDLRQPQPALFLFSWQEAPTSSSPLLLLSA